MPRITVQMFAGRTLDQKRAICKGITDVIEREAGASLDSITIVIEELTEENYSKAGVMRCDIGQNT